MSTLEAWVATNNWLLTIIGTTLAVADPMIATWLDTNRSVRRGAILVLVAASLGALCHFSNIPIGWRILAVIGLFTIFVFALGMKIERIRRKERPPVPCEALIGRKEIQNAGLDRLRKAKHSFDMIAVTGHTFFQDHRQDIENRLSAGVRFRILLLDRANANNGSFAESVGLTSGSFEGLVDSVQKILDDILTNLKQDNKEDYFQIRTIKKRMPFYSLWIADKDTVNVQLYSYRGHAHYKALRSGNRSFAKDAQADFDELWDVSK